MKTFTPWEHALLLRAYRQVYPVMLEFPALDSAAVAEHQWKRIKTILAAAYHGTPFYHDLYSTQDIHPSDVRTWSDFARLPTVTKQDIAGQERRCIVRTA